MSAEYEEHTRALLEQGFHHIKIGWASMMAAEDKEYYQRTIITPKASIDAGSIIEATSICRNIV